MTAITLSYLDKLQRANADDLAFYPLSTLADALDSGHVVTCEDNGERYDRQHRRRRVPA